MPILPGNYATVLRVHVTCKRSLSQTIVRSGRKPSRTINQRSQESREELSKFLVMAHYVGLKVNRNRADKRGGISRTGENARSRMHTRAYGEDVFID